MKPLKVKPPAGLNSPGQWFRYMKPWFDAEAYQERLNQRVGLNKDGKPIMRLAWGQDVFDTAYGATIPRYWTKRQKTTDGHTYWQVPRWFLERRIEPEQYHDAWVASRYSMQDEYGRPVDKGDPPPEYYLFAHLIAEHEALDASGWPACCTRAFYTDRSRCWGRYRQPGDFELQLVSQAVRQMEAEKWRDPYAPLTPHQLEELSAMSGMQVERAEEQALAQAREQAADFYGLSTSAIPENYGRRESGIIVPK
jgi:hypothetical protein